MIDRLFRLGVRIILKPFRMVRNALQQPAPVEPAPHPLVSDDGTFCCPVCETRLIEFQEFQRSESRPGRKGLCPVCGSLERTRAIRLFFEEKGRQHLHGQMLHFAPEKGLEQWLRSISDLQLTTTDLTMEGVDVAADITDMPFEDGQFQLIYCSNVLEHIPNDAAAMRELRRVLAPDGLAVIQVPIKGATTYEDPTITDPAEREQHFGQDDHVRWYGTDIKDRLEVAGFTVHEILMPDHLNLPGDQKTKYGVDKQELIHFCSLSQ